jgi:hypothetical protein
MKAAQHSGAKVKIGLAGSFESRTAIPAGVAATSMQFPFETLYELFTNVDAILTLRCMVVRPFIPRSLFVA